MTTFVILMTTRAGKAAKLIFRRLLLKRSVLIQHLKAMSFLAFDIEYNTFEVRISRSPLRRVGGSLSLSLASSLFDFEISNLLINLILERADLKAALPLTCVVDASISLEDFNSVGFAISIPDGKALVVTLKAPVGPNVSISRAFIFRA
jgi:hypothetical protein